MLFTPRPKGLGKENFLKLNDGEEVTGLFRGEIHTFRRHWNHASQRSIECVGADCSVCQADPENFPAFRFRVNFLTTKDGQWIAKIFEGGGELYDQLAKMDSKFDLTKTVVDISRQGMKQNTKYHIMPRPDVAITKEMEAKLKTLELLPLSTDQAEEAGA